ncbi:sec-independent protein translocase protein TATA, chloroplastic-like [Musa acuminata AAA Group]|uniref:sec-independent protein translocase protein TATA, chloroplastic-like n=1 Tax=Musa acuminata AAA Group TaxID=214697 RepID=UPI0031DDFE0A
MAAMAFPSTSLMASTPRVLRKPSSLASSSSLFLVSGGGRAARAPLLRRQHGGGALGCRCLFGLGVPELVVIAGVAALVFGPKKLPEIGRSFGKTIKSFQQAAKEFETELKKDPEDSSNPPSVESPKAVSSEDDKKELETSGTKDST